MEHIRGGLHLIGAALEVKVPLPIRVSETLHIERPDEKQTALVQKCLSALDLYGYAREHFETVATRETGPDGVTSIQRAKLPESERRYLLLTFDGTGNDAYFLLNAAQLVVPTLWSLLHVYTKEPFGRGDWAGHGLDALVYQRQIPEWAKGSPHPILDEPAIGRIMGAYSDLCRLDRETHPGVSRAVELFSLFARMPLMQVFDVLAMFMIIEMLLTHNPNDKEIGDSLTHQVCCKVPFVFERRKEQIEYSVFGNAGSDRVWKMLYGYRSSIAHGDVPDFNSKLKLLRDADTANRFLTDVTRRLVRFNIDDPELFEGLKPM